MKRDVCKTKFIIKKAGLLLAICIAVQLAPPAAFAAESAIEPPGQIIVMPEVMPEEQVDIPVVDTPWVAQPASLLNEVEHVPYIKIVGGVFRPNSPLTRAEMADMLYILLAQKPADAPDMFTDDAGQSYEQAANALVAVDIIRAYDDKFYPANVVARDEFASTLVRCFPSLIYNKLPDFADVAFDHWGREAIALVTERNWISAYEDGFHPTDAITRADAVIAINRALGRSADANTINAGANIAGLLDVTPGHNAYLDVLEAAIPHTYMKNAGDAEQWSSFENISSSYSPGLLSIDGDLFYINENGQPYTSTTIGGKYFGDDGRYTTKNPQLDQLVKNIVRKVTRDDMTMMQKRQALYAYVRDNYTYRKRPNVGRGATGFENEYGLQFFQTGVGNCYSFASAYGLLMRQVGFDIRVISGVVGRNAAPHGWVEVTIDGATRFDDPELDMAERRKGNRRNFFNVTYGSAPFIYRK